MFNPTLVVIDAFVERLKENYRRIYGHLHPDYPEVLEFVGRMALENISNSDAPYHDLHHTIMVTEVGQEILVGRHIIDGNVSARDWLHFVIALLCHDIGYVRGVCRGDRAGEYIIDEKGNTVALNPGATDASLAPYHVERSKIFVTERFGRVELIDHIVIRENIEFTRFPVPVGDKAKELDAYPGLLRAADLIGQMADINYLRNGPRLFAEFQEIGANEKLGYRTPADLRTAYPKFFWSQVSPFIGPSLRYLGLTQQGKIWVASLYANVFIEEHREPWCGAER
jgi:hypothetical protein